MNDDYLWDRSGEPDPEVVRLEEALGTLRQPVRQHRAAFRGQAGPRQPAAWWRLAVAAAASVAVLATGIVLAHRKTEERAQPSTAWQLSFAGKKPEPMYAGQSIETARGSRGTIESDLVGRVEIEPESLLRLLAAGHDEQRLALDHGTIHALIWAPPAQFIVETPGAKAVDLGCQYTLQVDRRGTGLLTVETGWVAFEWHGVESFIPAGAACRTRPEHGPDTPYFLDASPAFQRAITEFDKRGSNAALRDALATARPRDGLTLWHLLQRVPQEERGEVFERLAKLVSIPPGVKREAIERGDRRSLDATWDSLNLGSTNWWREWKRRW